MKKLIITALLIVQSLFSIAQTITVFEKDGTYSTTNIYGTTKYVKPGDSFIIKMVLDEGTVDNFMEVEGEYFNLTADADFFTSVAGVSYSVTASTDVITLGTVSHPNNYTIGQTVDISGQASQDILEIVDVTVTIPNDLSEGSYDIKLAENFVIGLSSPTTILTIEYKKGDVSVQNLSDNYITGETLKVQKGQVVSTKVNINEPDGYNDYFGISNEWNIDLNIPSGFDFIYSLSSLSLKFDNPGLTTEEHSFDIANSAALITNSGRTIHQDLNITGVAKRDQIRIENVHIQIPTDIAEGSGYAMQLAHDFIPGESSSINLLYFSYESPDLSVVVPDEDDKPCADVSGTFELADIPEGLEYYLILNDELIIDGSDTTKVVNGDTYDFELGDVVKVREKFMTSPVVESDPVIIDENYFKSLSIAAVSGETVFCPNAPVDFIINTGCGDESDFVLTFSSDNGSTWEPLSPAPIITDNADNYTFTYTPLSKGTIKVDFEGLEATLDFDVLSNYTSYDFKDYYAFPMNDSAIDLLDLEYEAGPPFTTNHEVDLPFKLADNSGPNKAYRQSSVTDFMFYRFDVPYDPFLGTDLTDSLYFDRTGIYKGAGIPNFVKLYFGKYYNGHTKYCYDSTTTAIYIIRDDIFVPETNFCSNDNQTYQIEINTDLTDYTSSIETANNVYKFANYSGYDIVINGVYNDPDAGIQTSGSGNIININPYQWVEDGTEFKIIAKAQIELQTYTSTTCSPQWNKFSDYDAGQEVLHNGIEYVALQDITGSGIILDPIEQEITSETRAIPIGVRPIVIYITPGVHDEYWGELGACELGTNYSSVFSPSWICK
jgi:hypothetical protein